MLNEILNAANKYAEGNKNVEHRREAWIPKCKLLTQHLKEIAEYLNKNASYKPGYYVDTSYAFDEKVNGTCVQMPSVTFRSGDMPVDITFKDEQGKLTNYVEKGFQITFSPTPSGEIAVVLFPHHSEMHEADPAYTMLMLIENLDELTLELVDDIISKGMEAAFYTSYVGMAEAGKLQQEQEEQQQKASYTPIGFKRYQSTQPGIINPGIAAQADNKA